MSEWCKTLITALALPEQTFNSLSCTSLLVKVTPIISKILCQLAENMGQISVSLKCCDEI